MYSAQAKAAVGYLVNLSFKRSRQLTVELFFNDLDDALECTLNAGAVAIIDRTEKAFERSAFRVVPPRKVFGQQMIDELVSVQPINFEYSATAAAFSAASSVFMGKNTDEF
jgi:hypothetical protein